MSYTRQYQKTITLKKTVPVSLDLTDSKGNSYSVTKQVSVELSEELYFDINVNTDPFDNSVDSCSTNVNNLKKAVIATEAAEVAIKTANTIKLGHTLGDGFVQLICLNVEMQSKEEKAKAEAFLMALNSQSKELLNKKGVMEGDYNRIKERYTGTFQHLNQELKNRILTLNKDTFGLILQSNQTLCRNTETALMATALIGHKENTQLQTALCVSSMKQKAQQLIHSAYCYISETIGLYHQIQADLIDENVTERKAEMVPVLYSETKNEQSDVVSELYNNELLKSQGVGDYLLKQTLQSLSLTWKQMDTDVSLRIAFYMDKKIAEYSQDDPHGKRVSAMIRSLWQKQQPLVLTTK